MLTGLHLFQYCALDDPHTFMDLYVSNVHEYVINPLPLLPRWANLLLFCPKSLAFLKPKHPFSRSPTSGTPTATNLRSDQIVQASQFPYLCFPLLNPKIKATVVHRNHFRASLLMSLIGLRFPKEILPSPTGPLPNFYSFRITSIAF